MISTHVIKEMRSPVASPLDALGRQQVFGRFLKDAEMCGWSGVQPVFFIWFQHTAKASSCQAVLDDATHKTQKSPCTHGLLYSWGLMRGNKRLGRNHSHSMVAGGLDEMSYTTRLTPRTSLMMRLEIRPSSS